MNLPERLVTPRGLLVDDEPRQLGLGTRVVDVCGSVVTANDPTAAISISVSGSRRDRARRPIGNSSGR